MRLMQSVGQAGDDPAYGLNVGCLVQIAAVGTLVRRWQRKVSGLDPAKGFEEVTAAPLLQGDFGQRFQQTRQARAAEVGHAEGSQPPVRKCLLREQRDNMRVLESGQ